MKNPIELAIVVVAILWAVVASYRDSKNFRRIQNFLSDFPTILQAAASSLAAGVGIYQAFERALILLPATSLARIEVAELLKTLQTSANRRAAVENFARNINCPEADLFRSSFLLVLENGGKYGPSLQRAAQMCRSRALLVESAAASTATMRLTANILLLLIPALLAISGSRGDDYWQNVLQNSVCYWLTLLGATLVAGGYLTLLRMSNFRA